MMWEKTSIGWEMKSILDFGSESGSIVSARWYVIQGDSFSACPGIQLVPFLAPSVSLPRDFSTKEQAMEWCETLERRFRRFGRLAFSLQAGQEAKEKEIARMESRSLRVREEILGARSLATKAVRS